MSLEVLGPGITKLKVAVIIVNWNGLGDTIKCVDSVLKLSYPDFQVIVVDNGSKIDEAEALKKLYNELIHLIRVNVNRGYSAGINHGIRYALKIEIFPYISQQHEYVRYAFKSPIELSNKDFISFIWYGNNSGIRIALRFETGDWRNQYEFSFIDSWNGWARLIIPLKYFSAHVGSPSWNNITAISFVFYEEVKTPTTFYVDRVTADKGITDFHFIPLEKLKVTD